MNIDCNNITAFLLRCVAAIALATTLLMAETPAMKSEQADDAAIFWALQL